MTATFIKHSMESLKNSLHYGNLKVPPLDR